MPTRIAIVEDSAGFRTGWMRLLDAQPSLCRVGAFASGKEALSALPALRPDVVLMDMMMTNPMHALHQKLRRLLPLPFRRAGVGGTDRD
jgi:DNA-binding NarL/FixJ family response regulator